MTGVRGRHADRLEAGMSRPARWRCSDPTCPAYRWQAVTGDGDPLVLARRAISQHLEEVHHDDDTHAYADTEVNR